jgi:O-antigen/teichoic acid export membrane protein
MTIYSKVDTVMLERMLPNGDFYTGIYAQGYRIVESLSMIGYLFSVLLLPVFAYQIKNRLNFASVIQTALKMLYPFAVSTVIFIWFYTVPIANWLYTDLHPQTFESMGIVNLIFLPVSMGYIFGTLLTANGSLKFLNRVSFAGLMVNLLLNYWLIPVMQTKGAALASVITQSLVVIIQIIYCIKIFRFSLNIKKVVSFIAFPLICYLTLDFLDRNTGLFWGYNFLIFAGLNLIILRLMNLLPVKDFLQLLNWRK